MHNKKKSGSGTEEEKPDSRTKQDSEGQIQGLVPQLKQKPFSKWGSRARNGSQVPDPEWGRS